MANYQTIDSLVKTAEQEREIISLKVKDGISVAKDRGVRFGKPNSNIGSTHEAVESNSAIARNKKSKVDIFALGLKGTLLEMKNNGMNLSAMAKSLNKQNIRTFRNDKWHANSVRSILIRIQQS